MMTALRNWLRRAGLVQLISPMVSWVEQWRLARVCNYSVAQNSPGEVAFLFDGRRVTLRTATPQFRQMACSRHERPTTAVFLRHIHTGDTVWDVGANVGYYTCLSSGLVGDNGKIIAFEPNPSNFQRLNENIRRLQLPNVQSLRTALADYDGEARMENADGVTSESRLAAPGATADTLGSVVAVTTGDTLVTRGDAPPPDFIKIDVEGFEYEVIRGLKNVLTQPRCRKLLCEIHFGLLAARGRSGADREIITSLRAAGFDDIQWVSRSHLLALKK